MPFSFLSPATKTGEGERAAPAAWAGSPGGSVVVRGVGEKGEGATGSRFPAAARAEVARGSLATAAGGGDRGGGATRLDGSPELGEKGGGDLGDSIAPLTLGRGGARRRLRGGRRGSAAMVGGGGVRSSRKRRAVAEVAVVLGDEVEGLLIGVARRWS